MKNKILYATLAFQAGFLNAFGFLACGRYVSHVTGIGTQIGIEVAEKNMIFALQLCAFPLFFALGAFVSGSLTSAKISKGLKPRYELVTFFLLIMLLVLTVLGSRGFFGIFGEKLIYVRDFILLFSLTFVCGMQNACFSTYTNGRIRTTHLTGIVTDFGNDFAKVCFGKLNREDFKLTRKTNLTRVMIFTSFAMGSVCSVLATNYFDYSALFFPAITAMFSHFWLLRIESAHATFA